MQAKIVKAFDGGGLPGQAGFDFCCDYGNPTYKTYINSEEGHDLGLSGSKGDIQYYEKLDQKYHIASGFKRKGKALPRPEQTV